MHVKGLWRYPVKSLGGEALDVRRADASTACSATGSCTSAAIAGRHGPQPASLLTIPASTGPDGGPLVAGHPWDSPAAAEIVRERGGDGRAPRAYDGPERFDILNLSVATDGAVDELGDRRPPPAAEHPARRRPAGRCRAPMAGPGARDRRRADRRLRAAPALHRDDDRPRQRRAGHRRPAPHPRALRRAESRSTAG